MPASDPPSPVRVSGVPSRAGPAVAATGLLLAVGLAACAGEPAGPAEPTPSGTVAVAPMSSPATDATDPTPDPSEEKAAEDAAARRPTTAPVQRLDAGAVADGISAQLEGTDDVTLTFQRHEEIAVVARLDCTDCSGPAVLTGPGRSTPWGEGFAGLEASYLVQWTQGGGEEEVWLAVEGPWRMELLSWNDLEPLSGEQSGKGPAVLLLADRGRGVHVRYEPADAQDALSARSMGTVEGTALVFGDTAAMDEPFEVALPGVLALNTRGEWTVTPLS